MKTAHPSHHESGFTIIELIMVIVLIGILAVGARSVFSSRDAYSGFLGKDQLISAALLAQQHALGMSAVTDPVTLRIANTDGNWIFTVTKTAGGLEPFVAMQEAGSSVMSIDGVTLGDGASRTFTWNSQASLTSGANHEIRFSGETTWRVCLSASGYAYEAGVCP